MTKPATASVASLAQRDFWRRAARYATVMYTTVALIACPDGNDQLLAVVPHSKMCGRGREKPTLRMLLRPIPPAVATSNSPAEYLCRVSQRNSAATPTMLSTTIHVPSIVISTMSDSTHGV